VAAIAIQLEGFAGAFTGRAAILAVGLGRTGTNRVLTLFLLVCHASLLVLNSFALGAQSSINTRNLAPILKDIDGSSKLRQTLTPNVPREVSD
jgi:hypothetical protein